jgi:hypothetical protein
VGTPKPGHSTIVAGAIGNCRTIGVSGRSLLENLTAFATHFGVTNVAKRTFATGVSVHVPDSHTSLR